MLFFKSVSPWSQGIDGASLQLVRVFPALVDVHSWCSGRKRQITILMSMPIISISISVPISITWNCVSQLGSVASMRLAVEIQKKSRSIKLTFHLLSWIIVINFYLYTWEIIFSHLSNFAMKLMIRPLSQWPSLGSLLFVAVRIHFWPG